MTQQGLPLNDDTDYGLCFACGPRNPWGLKLRFETEGDRVTTTFTVSEEYQGFPGYLQGGVAGSILDETMSRVSLLEGRWTMTALMDVRFRFPVPVGSRVTVEAVKTGEIRGFLKARGGDILARRSGGRQVDGHLRLRLPRDPARHGVVLPRLGAEVDEVASWRARRATPGPPGP